LNGERRQNRGFDKINKLWQKDEVALVCKRQVQATSVLKALALFLSPLNQQAVEKLLFCHPELGSGSYNFLILLPACRGQGC
jgi:hypothetical protein